MHLFTSYSETLPPSPLLPSRNTPKMHREEDTEGLFCSELFGDVGRGIVPPILLHPSRPLGPARFGCIVRNLRILPPAQRWLEKGTTGHRTGEAGMGAKGDGGVTSLEATNDGGK